MPFVAKPHLPAMFILLALTLQPGLAQGFSSASPSTPIVGGTGGLAVPANKFSMGPPPKVHLTSAGKACVAIHGFSKQGIIDPTLFEHTLIIENLCSKAIDLRVCPYQSQNCTPVRIEAYARRQHILSIEPNSKDFRYSYTEVFSGFGAF